MEKTIEIEYLFPIVAMISAGKNNNLKVSFWYWFFRIKCLSIGTKFINIFRYNPSIWKNPKLYNLKLKNIVNGSYNKRKY